MSQITPRIPNINWSDGFEKHWIADNPAATHAFNTLSFMFPLAEKNFIKVVKEVSQEKNLTLSSELEHDVKAFILQEAAHSKQHQSYNDILLKQGFENVIHNWIVWQQKIIHKYLSPIQKLAIVCTWEHYTAVLGNFLLSNPEVLKTSPKTMSLIWGWHAAEETEHKSVCFDLYQTAGGSWFGRLLSYFLVSSEFLVLFTRLYFSMLWRDGALNIKKLPKTLIQAARFFFGFKGVGWHVIFYGLKFLIPGFHPWKQDNRLLLKQWFKENNQDLRELS